MRHRNKGDDGPRIVDEEAVFSVANLSEVTEVKPDEPRALPGPQGQGSAHPRSVQPSALKGRVETLSTEFAIGWASVSAANHFSHVYAVIDTEVIGFGVANITRPVRLHCGVQPACPR